jgi:hypothetical protein
MATAETPKRFFVEVMAPDRVTLRRLHGFGLDLFRTTASEHRDGGFRIEGLVTLEEVGRLVEDGYPVLVAEEASQRAGGVEWSDLSDWLVGRGA